MKYRYRILLTLGVFLLGVALIPVMGLPAAGFSWQSFADVYVPTTLEVNHPGGLPGSFFSIPGTNYPPNANLDVRANGVSLGSVQGDLSGDLLFVIDSSGADLGNYTIEVGDVSGVYTRFELTAQGTMWPQEDAAPVLLLPADIANRLIFLPSIHR